MSNTKVNSGSRSNVRYLYNLVALAKVDGEITEHELLFLKQRSKELGITDVVLQSLIVEANSVTTPIMETIQERLDLMADCVKMASADGIITESERIFCHKICQLLELNESFVQEITEQFNISVA